jgi:hypothetical protein
MSNGTSTASKSCDCELTTESLTPPRSSAMSVHSSVKGTPQHIREWLMSFQRVSPANPSASQEISKEATTPATCGLQPENAYASYDLSTRSWKTSQVSLLTGTYDEFLETWPRWGTMQNGVCWELDISAAGIFGRDSGWWLPTLGKTEYKGTGKKRFRGSPEYRGSRMSEGLRTCAEDPAYLHPSFGEHAMGWPITWSELAPLGTAKFLLWLRLHGKY